MLHEQPIVVAGIPLPETSLFSDNEALQLFKDNEEVIGRICSRYNDYEVAMSLVATIRNLAHADYQVDRLSSKLRNTRVQLRSLQKLWNAVKQGEKNARVAKHPRPVVQGP
jgi:hypothetical protein